MNFALNVLRGLVKAEAEDPAVRRAVRGLEMAVVAVAVAVIRQYVGV